MSTEYVLMHCISSDFAMGAGIAKEFTRRGVKTALQSIYHSSEIGDALITTATNYKAEINLVTKCKYWLKPTYDTLRLALLSAKKLIIANNYTKIAIPRIGCGLDKLQWFKVKAMLDEIFNDTDVEILVCCL